MGEKWDLWGPDLPWQGLEENQANMRVNGSIQQTIDIKFIVLDKCCEKNIVDLVLDDQWLDEMVVSRVR